MSDPKREAPENDFHAAVKKQPNSTPLDGGAHHDVPSGLLKDPVLSKIAQRAMSTARGTSS